MPAFYGSPFEPVAAPGQAVRLEPANTVFEVKSIEQLGRIGPVDFGAAAAGADASESSSTIIDLDGELDMNDNRLGQFVVNPLSRVEVEVRQTGNQDQRFINKNQVGKIESTDPPNQRLVWVYEDNAPQVIVTNPQNWDMAKTLLYFIGFKYVLGSRPLSRQQVADLPGEPTSVPVDSLKKSPEEALD